MAAAVLSFQSIPQLPSCLPFNKSLKLRKPVTSLFNLTEIADKSPPFCSLQLSVSSITSDGNSGGSRPKRTSASGRNKGDESKKPSDGNKAPSSANREEIIALFRRIQASISKGETGRDKTKSLSSSKDKSTAESVLDVLRESRKSVRVTRSRKAGKAMRWKRGTPKKTQGMEEKADAATPDFKFSRPPSNFVKRSPIPNPTAPRVESLRPKNEVVAATDEGSKSASIENMKLPELKELAKAKGIKGYSRLKKNELVQLLSS